MTKRGEVAKRSIHATLSNATIVVGVLFVTTMVIVLALGSWMLFNNGWSIGLESPKLGRMQILRQPSFRPSWSDDGTAIVLGYRTNIYVVDAVGGEVKKWTPQGAPGDEDYTYDFGPVVTSKAPNPALAGVASHHSKANDRTTSQIVFYTLRHSSTTDMNLDIGMAYLDGSNYRRLTDTGADVFPVWSPDGNRIAFLSSREGSRSGLYVMNANGSNVQEVGRGLSGGVSSRPIWSPDSAHLAVRAGYLLYVITDVVPDVLGSEKSWTTPLGLTTTSPAWSPDSRRIAFVLIGPTPGTQETATIYTSKPDGSDTREVVKFYSEDVFLPDNWNLSWSSDGLSLRFSLTHKDARYALYQIGIDGSDLEEVSELDWRATIAWSPDGSRAAISHVGDVFMQYRHGETLLYTMTSDGSDKRVLVKQGSDGPEAANGR